MEFLDMGSIEESLLNNRIYLILGLTVPVSLVVLIASLVEREWGVAALSLIALVIVVAFITKVVPKDIEKRRQEKTRRMKRPPS